MKTKQFMIWLVFTTIAVNTFAFTVSRNTVVTIEKQTQVKLQNLDLHNDGTLIGDTASLLIISNTREAKITGNSISLSSLKIAGNVAMETPTLSLIGDLIMQSGVMNIGSSRLIIHGDLLGENEKTYIAASTGTIKKPIGYLPAGRSFSALGLEFTPKNDIYDLLITRSHNSVMRTARTSTTYSANRVFNFSTPMDISAVRAQILPHEILNIYKLTLFVRDYEDWKRVKSRNDDFFAVSRVAAFSPDHLFFPKIITPNESTNNKFEIVGLDEYPNARLIIINKKGEILYDLYPYTNDFDGKNLPSGTYYYVFSEQRNGEPVKKSFFEIIR